MNTSPNSEPTAAPTQPIWGDSEHLHVGQTAPIAAPPAQGRTAQAPQGQLPLGRIVLGVILGLTIWSAIMIVIFTILMFGLFREAHGLVDDVVDQVHSTSSTSDTGLSDSCVEAIKSGDLDKLQGC